MSREDFIKSTNVSRETIEHLDAYAALLTKWNKAINLVAPSTIASLWSRHFLDSAQILDVAPKNAKSWVDMGSGAGFPGLVVACLAKEKHPDLGMTCIESDQRKSVFLQTVIRNLGLKATVISQRIEQVPRLGADIVSARALSRLEVLLGYADRHLSPEGTAIFLKGAGFGREIEQAQDNWTFDIRTEPSKTDADGALLICGGLKRE